MKKVFLAFFILVILGLMGYLGYYMIKKTQKEDVVFKTSQPFVTDIIKKTVATGSIVPRREVEMKPQVSGIIDKLYVEAGETVKKGQLLAKIQVRPNSENLNNASATVKRSTLRRDEAKKELDRQKALFDKGVISKQVLEQFEYEYNLAVEELSSAMNNLQIIKEGAAKNSGQVANLVISTIDGMVLDVPVKEGTNVIESNTFNEGTTIATVADMSQLIFEGNVDESEVGKLKEGMPIQLRVAAIDDRTFDAQLEYISPKGVDQDGTIQFEIKASVKLPEDIFLRAGFSANADIVLDKKDSVLAINEGSVIFDKDGLTYVELKNGSDQFDKKEVKLGLSDGINIEIVSGVGEKDEIKSQE
ncbi:MAG: efflux RND transporter periplasmic adaptor subunit [Chitinophagales bacterium]|nr:efflux RND transporter periplasmic adaptor subunit [Chitinophagales bacterium]